ncbi:MAG TPA: hypothetical protein VN726_14145 [Hanamia sp.]|nr:hypothetical protein [Hanamia sp.]
MKKLWLVLLTGFVFNSCGNNKSSQMASSSDSTAQNASVQNASTQKMNYPYTIDQPDNWDIGSAENTMVALSALKAYENGNVDESMKYFGDSVRLEFDKMDTTLSHDSLTAMFTRERKNIKSMNVRMDDWESVVSKDKKDEWVTLWYREKWVTSKGKIDSADVINDLKMKNGKIIRLDEYNRILH